MKNCSLNDVMNRCGITAETLAYSLVLGAAMIGIACAWRFYNSRRCKEAYAELERLKASVEERVSIMCTNILKSAEHKREIDAQNELRALKGEETQYWNKRKEEFCNDVKRREGIVRKEAEELDWKIKQSISGGSVFQEGEIEVGRLGLTKVWIEKKFGGEIQIGFDFNHVTENIVAGVQLFDQFGVCISDVEKRVPAKYEHNKEIVKSAVITYAAMFVEKWAEMKCAQGADMNSYYFMESESKKTSKPTKEESRRVRSAAKNAAIKTAGAIGSAVAGHYTRKMGEVISDESGVSLFDIVKIDAAKLPAWPPSYMRIYVGVE